MFRFFRRIAAIPAMLRDKTVSIWKKVLIAALIIYTISPVDLIPFIWGGTILIWILVIWCLRKDLDQYGGGSKKTDFSRQYRGKTIIKDVKYEVRDEEEEKDQHGQG